MGIMVEPYFEYSNETKMTELWFEWKTENLQKMVGLNPPNNHAVN
jgi:hypothetical protein